MKKTKLLIYLAAVLAIFIAPANAEPVIVNSEFGFSLLTFVPCAYNPFNPDGGRGDEVSIVGPQSTTIHGTINNFISASGEVHFFSRGVNGKGIATSINYHDTGSTKMSFENVPVQSGVFHIDLVNRLNLVGEGPQNKFSVRETVHITVNVNVRPHTATVTVDDFKIECD